MKRLKSGDIIEIALPEIDKYCYCKYIDKRKYQDKASYPFQFKVSSSLSTTQQELDSVDFSRLLFSPWHLMGHKTAVETGRWRVVGNIALNNDDFIQHHYKMAWPPNLLTTPTQAEKWRVLKNIDNVNVGVMVSYEQCSHLEDATNYGALHLELRIVTEYLKLENRLESINKSDWDKYDYILFEQFNAIPVYVNLPVSQQGRLIEI